MGKEIIVFSTVPTIEEAKSIARKLVEKKLAACVNIIPSIESIYFWKEEICEDKEVLMIIKTTLERFSMLEKVILDNHSYTCPEIIYTSIEGGFANYLSWINEIVEDS